MSLDWIPLRSDAANEPEMSNGKRVGGLHPLIDSDGGKIISEDDARRQVVIGSHLPSHVRNASSLKRDDVKEEVLSHYTANVPISSFITLEDEKITEQERARMRADRLGSADASSVLANQTSLIRLIEGLDSDLKNLWASGEKVKALRVAIQSSKLLAVNKVPHCFPSIFVLVATVLDSFGNFVAERLQATAAGKSFVVAALIKRGQDASIDLIPLEAVEMCYNWFLKISSIRELLPRICIELSLLKCNKFLMKRARVQPADVVVRLARQIRGVADPLVASHLRWYLFMRAAEVLKADEWASVLETTCLDNFATIEQLRSVYFERYWTEKDITKSHYLSLFIPSLQWQLDTIAKYGSKANRQEFIKTAFESAMKVFTSSTLLLPLMRAFSSKDWLQFGLDNLFYYVDEVEYCKQVTKLQILEVLALILAEHPQPLPLSRAKKTAFLNEVWSRIELCGSDPDVDANEFLGACSAVLQFCAAHMAAKQVNVLLAVVRKFLEAHPNESVLQQSVFTLLSGLTTRLDISALLSSDHFLTLLSHVDPKARNLLARTMLRLFPRDAQFSEVALELSKTLNETYDLLHLDEVSQQENTAIIVAALRAVTSQDAERQIEFMCQARHALPNLDEVKVALVDHALALVHHFGKLSKKRNAAKAFLAFCHVTIPAADNVFSRMKMSIEAAGTAFLYGFVAQGEAILRLAMDFMKEFTMRSTKHDGTVISNDAAIVQSLLQLIALGCIIPSHAKYGHNYVLSAVLAWNEAFIWDNSSTGRSQLNCAILRCLSKAMVGAMPYRFTKCGTENYVQDPDYMASCREIATSAAKNTLLTMQAAGDNPPNLVTMGNMSLELFETCIAFADISATDAVGVREIAAESWAIALKCHVGTDVEYTRRLAAITRYATRWLGAKGFEQSTNVVSARVESRQLNKALQQEQAEEVNEGDE